MSDTARRWREHGRNAGSGGTKNLVLKARAEGIDTQGFPCAGQTDDFKFYMWTKLYSPREPECRQTAGGIQESGIL